MAQKKKTNRIGNKQNSFLNQEWAGHVRRWFKKYTSSVRRMEDKKIIKDRLENEK